MKIALLVTHLLGAGHLTRAMALARGFTEDGLKVTVLSGGRPAPHISAEGVELVQLPPISSDGAVFSRLMTPEGVLADEAYLTRRREHLTSALRDLAPDMLITETFPFGRRPLAAEYDAAVETVANQLRPALIYASIRDILASPRTPERAAEAHARLARRYGGVLVHSDSSAVPLEASWPVTPRVAKLLRYTGFVAPKESAAEAPGQETGQDGRDEVIVAAGGGPVGETLFEIAIQASRLTGGRRWRLVVGGGAERAARLAELARGAPVIAEPARPDYRALLRRAALSVSQCGYNTALDLLRTGVPAVLVPFEENNETEQRLRAETMARRFGYQTLRESELTPDSLAAAAKAAMAAGRIDAGAMKLDGVAESTRIVRAALEARA